VRVIREMASSGAHSLACDECLALSYVGEIAQAHHIGFIGNLHVTPTLFEERDDPAADVNRCLTEGRRFPGYVFGLGGPLTQHLSIPRLETAVAAFVMRRDQSESATVELDLSRKETIVPRTEER
jgi:hypothetical protein